ncbi:hypothetical protein PG993_011397 [Apiospora rasikravindrae]|uniref:Uncharacterized protein n=1 Tax=Apiospora rasikravindrae TaxID=990691 RepID=A0ABR1SEH2_9PEZI
MRLLSILFTILCSAAIWNLRRMVQDLEEEQNQTQNDNNTGATATAAAVSNIYEKDVLTTTMYALGSGLVLNIIPGTEMMACAPYGVGAAAIAARLHTFSMGGLTAGHWDYARRTGPRQLQRWLREDVVGRAVGEAKRVTGGTGSGMGMEGAAGSGCGGAAEDKCEL